MQQAEAGLGQGTGGREDSTLSLPVVGAAAKDSDYVSVGAQLTSSLYVGIGRSITGTGTLLKLTYLFSDRWSDEAAGARVPLDGPAAALRYRPLAEGDRADAEVVFLATPAEVSADLAPKLLARGARVVDLSGAFRLAD